MQLQCVDTSAQLLASNLEFLLRSLAGETPRSALSGRVETSNQGKGTGGALFLRPAQQRELGL